MDSHSQLLDKWKAMPLHQGAVFISDGIIDPMKWAKVNRKVHFLLKEAYSDSSQEQDWDLCRLIRDDWGGPKYATMQRVARWAYLAQHLSINSFPNYPEASEGAGEGLLSCSISNIKKSGGASSSKEENLATYVKEDQELILDQIKLVGPEIVICGATWDLVKDILGKYQQITDYVYRRESTLFVDYWHPANRYPSEMNYYTLGAVLQDALRLVG